MKFYTNWRSLAALRVRIALNMKGIAAEPQYIDLSMLQQTTPEFRAINPQGALPTLVLNDGTVLFQSMAILEYLDAAYPQPPLLPKLATACARVRGIAQIAVADGHPLVVPRVRNYLEKELGLTEPQRLAWSRHWMETALLAIEGHLAKTLGTGLYCQGDDVSIADICLVSQVIGHGYFGGTLDAMPIIADIHARCMALDAFSRAHPLKQPDAPRA
jgi:maleylacetoacetate isomerase